MCRNRRASLLEENDAKDNARVRARLLGSGVVHPVLWSWRDDLSSVFVRGLAVFCGLVLLSLFATWIYETPPMKAARRVTAQPAWIEVEKPFPAFVLTIPEAAGEPTSYTIRRHALGGRKDIVTLGSAEGSAPFLQIEIYRPGDETGTFGAISDDILMSAASLGPAEINSDTAPLDTKFGPLTLANFVTTKGAPRACVAFSHNYDDPRLQVFGWFCQGSDYVTRSMLSCALDRLSLLSAGSEPKVTALFAQLELHRTFCGQRSPLLAPTPQHRALWRAMAENSAR